MPSRLATRLRSVLGALPGRRSRTRPRPARSARPGPGPRTRTRPSSDAGSGSRSRARLTAALASAFGIAALVVLPGTARAEPAATVGELEQQVLFNASQDPGYACFRIPAVVRT